MAVDVNATLTIDDLGVERPATPDDFKDPASARDVTVAAAVDYLSQVKARVDQLAADATLAAVRDRLPANLATDGGLPVHQQNLPDLSALAKDASLASILAGLGPLATEATLSALNGKVGIPTSDDLLSLLRAIQTNTATETVKTDTLHLDAQQIDLDTQGVESRLDTVNARIGTTGTAGTVAALLDAIRQNQVNQAINATLVGGDYATDTKLEAVRALLAGRLDTELPAAIAQADGAAVPTAPAVLAHAKVRNAAGTFDDLRSAAATTGTTGVGLLGVSVQTRGVSNYSDLQAAIVLADTYSGIGLPGAAGMVFNGSTWERLRSLNGITAPGTGILAVADTAWNGVTMAAKSYANARGDADNGTAQLPQTPWLYNGATYDRQRGNADGTALASAARTATVSSPDIINYNGDGLLVTLRVSAITTAPSLVVTIEGKDPASGLYYTLHAAPVAVTAVGTYVYEVAPGVGAASGGVTQRTSGRVPRVCRVTVTHGNANSVTYSVGYSMMTA